MKMYVQLGLAVLCVACLLAGCMSGEELPGASDAGTPTAPTQATQTTAAGETVLVPPTSASQEPSAAQTTATPPAATTTVVSTGSTAPSTAQPTVTTQTTLTQTTCSTRPADPLSVLGDWDVSWTQHYVGYYSFRADGTFLRWGRKGDSGPDLRMFIDYGTYVQQGDMVSLCITRHFDDNGAAAVNTTEAIQLAVGAGGILLGHPLASPDDRLSSEEWESGNTYLNGWRRIEAYPDVTALAHDPSAPLGCYWGYDAESGEQVVYAFGEGGQFFHWRIKKGDHMHEDNGGYYGTYTVRQGVIEVTAQRLGDYYWCDTKWDRTLQFAADGDGLRLYVLTRKVVTTTTSGHYHVHPAEDVYETLSPLAKDVFDKAALRLSPLF